MIIDPPSPFDTLEDWRKFLTDLQAVEVTRPEDKADVARYMTLARQEIAQREAAQ